MITPFPCLLQAPYEKVVGYGMFEDTKGVIKIRKSKDRQYNDKKKKVN